MPKILQKVQKNKYLGRYATKLPKFLAGVFSNPRLTCASTTLLCELLALGKQKATYHLVKQENNVYYLKNKVIPFLAKLKTLKNTPILTSIEYSGPRTITFSLSDRIYNEVQRSIQEHDYISVNLDDLSKLRGKYTKQIYLLLCKWQRGKNLSLCFKEVNRLFSLPKSCKKRFFSVVLEPALEQINEKTRLQTHATHTGKSSWEVFYYRKTKWTKKVKKIQHKKDQYYKDRLRSRTIRDRVKKSQGAISIIEKHKTYKDCLSKWRENALGKKANTPNREESGSLHRSCKQSPSLATTKQQG